ncbi:topoisomerase, partial [Escherichia coli]
TGYALIDALPGIAVNPDMTALWSEKQAAIENGDLTVEQFINDLYGELTGMISDVDLGEMKIEPAAPAG